MVLHGKPCGRVGRCRDYFEGSRGTLSGLPFFVTRKSRIRFSPGKRYPSGEHASVLAYHGARASGHGCAPFATSVFEVMKAEGIYTHFSIYFPLWFRPKANNPWLKGYDGKTVPFDLRCPAGRA